MNAPDPDDARAHDDAVDDDDPSTTSSRRDRAAESAVAVVAGLGAAVVVALFFVTVAHLQPVAEVGVVVVADPATPAGAPLHVRVLGVGARGRAPFSGTVAGATVGETGLVVVPRPDVLVVEGVVDDVPVRVEVALSSMPRAPDASVSVSRWSRALALPAQGAAVYPEAGLVTGRGTSRVVLVDDASLRVVDVEAGANARLPDGRLLLVDRVPLSARLRSLDARAGADLIVDVDGVDADDALAFELLLGGVVRALADGRGPGAHTLRVPENARVGELLVVRVSTSPLPSATGRTLVTRVGGPRHEDLVAVEPRLDRVAREARDVDDDVVERALLARLLPAVRQAPVASPSLHAQVARRATARDEAAMVWRERMRLAAALLSSVVVVVALRAARRAPALAAGAVLVVVALFVGLDAVVGAFAGTAGQ